MKLSELLGSTSDALRIPMAARDKTDAITQLVTTLEAAHDLDTRGEILTNVIERERMMSTGIGHGVAVPHAKSRHVSNVVATCGLVAGGLDFGAPDGAPVRLVVLLVSPESQRAPHVRALAAVSRLMLDIDAREALATAADPHEFQERLQEAEQGLGAK